MPSGKTNEATREEWRALGFYYDRDEGAKVWRLLGSRKGLAQFPQLLRTYASDPRNAELSEHDHYGPYMYLEIGTWSGPQVTDHWIAGTPADLSRLAAAAEDALRRATLHTPVRIDEAFAPGSEYSIVLELRDDNFGPAAAGPNCW